MTVIHETAHGKYREALETGRLSRSEVVDFFSKLDESLEGRETEAGKKLSFLKGQKGEGVTDTMLDEAVAEWMETETLRTRNGKSSKLKSIINWLAEDEKTSPTKWNAKAINAFGNWPPNAF